MDQKHEGAYGGPIEYSTDWTTSKSGHAGAAESASSAFGAPSVAGDIMAYGVKKKAAQVADEVNSAFGTAVGAAAAALK